MRSDYPICLFSVAFICTLLSSCASQNLRHEKIQIARFHDLNEQGLMGNKGSHRAISYEFCIPRDDTHVGVVKSIEPNIKMQKSSGRIGCTKEEYLCIGHTDEKYKQIFRKLVALPYVTRIDEAFFE